MRKRILYSCFAVLLIAAMLLSGCGKAATSGPVTIQIFVGIGTGDAPDQVALHKALQEEFNATHKDIQIEFITSLNAEARTKFSTMLTSGQAPDLVMPIGIEGVANFQDEWLDISQMVKDDGYDMSDFNAAPTAGGVLDASPNGCGHG